MEKIPYEEFKRRLMDPSVPDKELAPYLTVDPHDSSAFDPRVVPDPARVELGPEARFDVENAMRWANNVARWRRAQRFRERLAAGERLPVLVSEGDSWFQFPFLLEDVVDQLGADHLIWSLDAAGDTAENMVNRRPEYLEALRNRLPDGVQGFLFSAAGNDVIGEDEFGVPVLKALVKPFDPGKDAAAHIDKARLGRTLSFLEEAYRKVIATIRAEGGLRDLPILIHGYDYALPYPQTATDPRDPDWAARDEWLGAVLDERGVRTPELRGGIIKVLIDALYDMLADVAGDSARTRVFVVDVRGTLPDVAQWADEIHPTDAGFALVAERFRATLRDAQLVA